MLGMWPSRRRWKTFTPSSRVWGEKISGEHGIGLKRKKYMAEFMSPVEMGLIKAIKRAWDPNGIMNPGKLFDLD